MISVCRLHAAYKQRTQRKCVTISTLDSHKNFVQIISGKVTRLGLEARGNIVRFLAGPRYFSSPKLQTDLDAIQLSTQWVT